MEGVSNKVFGPTSGKELRPAGGRRVEKKAKYVRNLDVWDCREKAPVGTLKIMEKKENLNWNCDEEGDVLYISIGEPLKALGLDVEEGIVVRYREQTGRVVGLTIIGVKQRSAVALATGK